MAYTTAATGLTAKQWDSKFFTEYLGNSPWKPYMGKGETSIIQVKEDLTKKKGDTIHFALVNRLTGAANDGNSLLVGNEEAMDSRSFPLTVGLRRNAVTIREFEEQISAISLRNAARPTLMDWAYDLDDQRFDTALYSINGVAYGTATEGQKDTWLTDNNDRVLFGDARGNTVTGDHSASLLAVDNTMTLTAAGLSLMKRMALQGDPKIKPVRMSGMNKRYFVVFAGPDTFRDLKNDPVITQAQREVSLSKQNNKLFQGGDLEWDGMIIHEVDDMTTLAGVGAGGIDLGGVFLCGCQAFGMGVAARWKSTQKGETDYDNEVGIGIRSIDNLAKMTFGTGAGDTDDLKDHGVVTGYFASVGDA